MRCCFSDTLRLIVQKMARLQQFLSTTSTNARMLLGLENNTRLEWSQRLRGKHPEHFSCSAEPSYIMEDDFENSGLNSLGLEERDWTSPGSGEESRNTSLPGLDLQSKFLRCHLRYSSLITSQCFFLLRTDFEKRPSKTPTRNSPTICETSGIWTLAFSRA